MNPIVKLLHIIQWIFVFAAMIPLMLLGAFIVVPLALLFKADMKKLPIWGNAQEGYPDWFDRYVQDSWFKKIFPRWWWFSVRNPTNNIRFLFDDSGEFKIEGWEGSSMEAHDLLEAGVAVASLGAIAVDLQVIVVFGLTAKTSIANFGLVGKLVRQFQAWDLLHSLD